MGPAYWGLKKLMGCFCLQAKLLTGHLITGSPPRSEPALERFFQVKPSIRVHIISLFGLIWWLYLKHFFGCHDILMLGKSPIK